MLAVISCRRTPSLKDPEVESWKISETFPKLQMHLYHAQISKDLTSKSGQGIIEMHDLSD
jgi:hypothetical protein